jgi:hypothetical protein
MRKIVILTLLILLLTISAVAVHAQIVVLNQPPNQGGWRQSDPGTPQSVADNFILTTTTTITQIRIWGFYHMSPVPSPTDNFTVIFHNDSAGLPGAVITTQNNVPVICATTGVTIGPGIEYVFRLFLSPVVLDPGTYWVEIYNATAPGPADDFGWETGTVDPTNGIIGSAWSLTAPGVTWFPEAPEPYSRAIEISGYDDSIPTLNQWGMIIFVVIAGLGAIYYLRRETAKS